MLKLNKKQGITLVALVITIIILLILAGITIAELSGSGLFEKAKLSKEKYKNAQDEEENRLGLYEGKIDKYDTWKRTGESGGITDTQYQSILNRLNVLEKNRSGSVDFGKINGNSGTSSTITFTSPLENTNYSVIVTCTGGGANWATVEYNVNAKTVNGFTITAWNHGSGATGSNVTADWVMVPYNN